MFGFCILIAASASYTAWLIRNLGRKLHQYRLAAFAALAQEALIGLAVGAVLFGAVVR